jgi:hypothetical protein
MKFKKITDGPNSEGRTTNEYKLKKTERGKRKSNFIQPGFVNTRERL